MKWRIVGALLMVVCTAMAFVAVAADSGSYVHPEALASTEWLASNLGDPAVRIIATADC